MKDAIKQLLASRKVFLALLSAVVYGVGKLGLKIDAEDLVPIVAPLWGALFGVALEDVGKAKVKVLADAAGK